MANSWQFGLHGEAIAINFFKMQTEMSAQTHTHKSKSTATDWSAQIETNHYL